MPIRFFKLASLCALLTTMVACTDHGQVNPAKDAKLIKETDFREDLRRLIDLPDLQDWGYQIQRTDSKSGQLMGSLSLVVESREVLKGCLLGQSRATQFQDVLKSEVEQFQAFLGRYSKPFRIRKMNGGLALVSLDESEQENALKIISDLQGIQEQVRKDCF